MLTLKDSFALVSLKNMKNLAEASGSLYFFGRVMNERVADPRGCYLQLQEGGVGGLAGADDQISKSGRCHNAAVILLAYAWPSPNTLENFSSVLKKVKGTLYRKYCLFQVLAHNV